MSAPTPPFICPTCQRASANPNDGFYGYCGNCHTFPEDREIAEFKREQAEALLSLDEAKIRAFYKKWNEGELPRTPQAFWGAVHKTITGITSLPIEARRKSKAWLTERRMTAFDDGDL